MSAEPQVMGQQLHTDLLLNFSFIVFYGRLVKGSELWQRA
jgi:hypothetical protein